MRLSRSASCSLKKDFISVVNVCQFAGSAASFCALVVALVPAYAPSAVTTAMMMGATLLTSKLTSYLLPAHCRLTTAKPDGPQHEGGDGQVANCG